MVNTKREAIQHAREQSANGPKFGEGECLMRCRLAFGVTAILPDATAAWTHSATKHRTTDAASIPRGVPVFWTGGSHGHGHIAISAGDGMCWSTDIKRTGFFDKVRIDLIHEKWGLTLVGWTEDINGQRVHNFPHPAPTPAPPVVKHRSAADYSFARPLVRDLKASGHEGVMRYISNGSSKDLVRAEADALRAAGLWVGLVWETTAGRAGEGAAAGVADVKAAEAAATRLGYPSNAVIFYAVDFDATAARVKPYFDAIKAHASRPVGSYGSAQITDAKLAPWRWQTMAWSHGVVSKAAHMVQLTTKPKVADTDDNTVLRDLPVWKPGATPVKVSVPPKVTPAHTLVTPVKVSPQPSVKPAAGKTLRVVEWNLERDRNPGTVRSEVEALAKQTSADVLVFSEANDYTAVLRHVPGYVTHQFHDAKVPEKDGTAILVRTGLHTTNAHVVKVTSAGWRTARGGHTPPKWAVHVTVEGIEFEAASTPPSQQPAIKRKAMPARARAYDERMRNIKPSAHYVIVGDWNCTPEATNVPTFPRKRFAALGLKVVAPLSGTHGSRCIDYAGVKGVKATAATIVTGKRGSDHKPVQFTVTKE